MIKNESSLESIILYLHLVNNNTFYLILIELSIKDKIIILSAIELGSLFLSQKSEKKIVSN